MFSNETSLFNEKSYKVVQHLWLMFKKILFIALFEDKEEKQSHKIICTFWTN